jgi:hypothetical protein
MLVKGRRWAKLKNLTLDNEKGKTKKEIRIT